MGGCRCVFRDCNTSTYRNRTISFFHFPAKEPKRYNRWIELAKAQHIAELPKNKQKNRVICARHFRDECFMNYKKNSLTRLAIPTIWRLNKDTAIDYENNVENGELVTLPGPTQTHLIPPANFICPLGFNDDHECKKLLNGKMFEMSTIMQKNNPSDSSSNEMPLTTNATKKSLIRKQRLTRDLSVNIKEEQQQSKVLNGQIWKKMNTENLFITEYENHNNDSSSNERHMEMDRATDIKSLIDNNVLTVDDNFLSVINKMMNNENGNANIETQDVVEITDDENVSLTFTAEAIETTSIDATMPDNLVNVDYDDGNQEDEQNESQNPIINPNEEIVIDTNIQRYSHNTTGEVELMENIKCLKNTVADLTADLSKATIEINVKQIEINEYKKKCDNYMRLLKQQQQRQQRRMDTKELQYRQELKKMSHTKKVLHRRYEELQRVNRKLLHRCERLEKLIQQQQVQFLQETTATINNNQMSSESMITSSNPQTPTQNLLSTAPPIVSVPVQPPSKVRLFNSITRYISVAMASLLRMEMFGNADRPWKGDEKRITVDILRLGDDVYKYFIEEWRFRLPPIAEARVWSTMNNDFNEDNDL